MICPSCRKENPGHYQFCLGCGALLPSAPAGEPGGAPMPNAWAAAAAPAGRRCAGCGGGRTLPGAVGPTLGVRVFVGAQPTDLPLAGAMVCPDCGHVALTMADDVRRYLAGLLGRVG